MSVEGRAHRRDRGGQRRVGKKYPNRQMQREGRKNTLAHEGGKSIVGNAGGTTSGRNPRR